MTSSYKSWTLDSQYMNSYFISGSVGPCFVSVYLPKTPATCWVLHFPPFAEEMNKCRAMVSAQARELANIGVAVVVPDLYGTGDSAGGVLRCQLGYMAHGYDWHCGVASRAGGQ